MSVSAAEVPFSDLINHPKSTLSRLITAGTRMLRLRRRDDEDLVLTTASRFEADQQVVSATTALVTSLLNSGEPGRRLLLDALPDVFPWVRFLPAEDRRVFLSELVETLRGAEALRNMAPVSQVITEWRHTAEVHADPALRDALRRDGDDFGPATPPEVA